MTKKEKAIQRALGFLQSWVVRITGKDSYWASIPESTFRNMPKTGATIIVQAVSAEHALAQVRLANIIPLQDLKWAGAYQSEIFANHCREEVKRGNGGKNKYGEKIYIL